MVSREVIGEEKWQTLLAERMRTAIRRRKPLLDDRTNAARLVFSEADDLPGVIVDRYADLVSLQLLTKGLDNEETRAICAQVLGEELAAPITLWERPDPRIRELEGLSAPGTTPIFSSHPGAPAASTQFRLNGISQFRAKDRRLSGPARKLRSRCQLGHAPGREESSRCLHLSGRICLAPRRGVRAGHGDRCFARFP
jgi:23S rRNA (cytosine1962-C5)-methyltransferase